VKNKVAPPFKRVELEIIFGQGISASGSLLDAAVANSIIGKSGSWYSYGEERIGQGRENVKGFLESNPDMYKQIEQSVRGLLFPPRVQQTVKEEQKPAPQKNNVQADKSAAQKTGADS
jgi:recombination protein RecA